MLSKTVVILFSIVLAACLAGAGCGGVDVDHQGADPLKLLHLSPGNGEKDVPSDVDVVAVFSASMTVGEGEENLNELNKDTFFVEDEGEIKRVEVVEMSDMDPEEATAIIRLDGLDAGGEYTIVIMGTVEGADTDPLGVKVEATFTVAE